MNNALLTELQGLEAYPSVTLLHTTEPGAVMRPADASRLVDLAAEAERRLSEDVDDDVRATVVATLQRLVASASAGRSSQAIAICVSPDHEAVIRLGRSVRTRAIIDDNFATRDMVADANRTATFRVVTVSEQTVRLLVGDRDRLVEVHERPWPLERADDEGAEVWRNRVNESLERELRSFDVPTVLAGVAHTIGSLIDGDQVESIGNVPGNHDSSSPAQLHEPAWVLVHEWLELDRAEALARLDHARGARVFAGGVDEVWDLADDGRVELLVVEDDYHLTARVHDRHLEPVDDPDSPDIVDDVIDELIEMVLRSGGETVMVPPGELSDHGRIAAVLRY